MNKGKLIVLYGINNLGKSTQAKLLVKKLQEAGKQAEYLKYALYDIKPSGVLINQYLRINNPYQFSAREFQILQVLNRTQFDKELRDKLEAGIWVVAEDYVGTGIAWGMGAGVGRHLLEYLNSHLVVEDVAFFFRGARFMDGKESNHTHEDNDQLMTRVARCHEILALEKSWLPIAANDTIDNISQVIWQEIAKQL